MSSNRATTVLSTIGLCFVWRFFRANYYEDFLFLGGNDFIDATAYYYLFAVVALVLCAVLGKMSNALEGVKRVILRRILIGFAYAGVLAFLLILGADSYRILPEFFMWVGVVLWALSFVALMLLWTNLLEKLAIERAMLIMTVSFGLSFVFGFVANLLPSSIGLLATVCGIAVSVTCFVACPDIERRVDDESHSEYGKRRVSFELTLVVFFLMLSAMANGYLFADESIGFAKDDRLVYLATGVLIAALLVIALRRTRNLFRYMAILLIVLISVFAVGLVCMLTLSEAAMPVAQTVVVGVKQSLHYLLWIAVVVHLRKRTLDPSILYVVFIATQVIAGFFGYCLVAYLVSAGTVGLDYLVTLSAILLVIAVAYFCYRAIDLKRDPEKLASSEGAPSKKRVCQAVRRKYHLTEREEEVLALLTDGYSRKAIAKELFVSENTVATHLRVIYAKMECHRKDEVVKRVKECEEEQRLKAS